jgi:hypothetical protein
MKKLAIVFIGLFLMAFSMNVNAQDGNTSNASAVANADIVAPLTITNNLSLEFGEIIKDNTANGSVVITASATPTRTPTNVTFMPNDLWRPAQFTIVGEEDELYSINLPNVTLDGPGDDDLTIQTSMNANPANNVLTGGQKTLYVGGTMAVNADQTPGEYTGSFTVTVTYE